MARLEFSGESNNVSKPVKRMRWATQRYKGDSAVRKRLSILNRVPGIHVSSYEEKPTGTKKGQTINDKSPMGQAAEKKHEDRKIWMNIPLPDEAKTEEGYNKQVFVRNKIRTSKYTPLSFIPKNLWFQFHNIANIYFLFIIILSVSGKVSHMLNGSNICRFSPSSVHPTQV